MNISGYDTNMTTSQKTLFIFLLVSLAVFGAALIFFTMEFLAQVQSTETSQISEDRHQSDLLFLVVTMMAGMPAVGLGAYVMYLGSRIRATGQWPPAGMGFRSDSTKILGRRANFVGVGTMGLGGILVATGLGLPLLGLRLMNMFGE